MFIGKNHPQWKNGKGAYREMMLRSKKKRHIHCTRCGFNDIRALLVHHKDRNRENNALKNLVWLCHNCHYLVHHYKEELEKLSKLYK